VLYIGRRERGTVTEQLTVRLIICKYEKVKVKVKFTLEQATKAHRGIEV
jgi:hypothetical protein